MMHIYIDGFKPVDTGDIRPVMTLSKSSYGMEETIGIWF